MPAKEKLQFIDVAHDGGEPGATRIAARVIEGAGRQPGIFWLNGFMSVMAATKISALSDWAGDENRSIVKFDYSGHGESDGEIASGTVGRWLTEAHAVFKTFAVGPQIIVGSSMGGWIALLLNALIARAGGGNGSVKAIVLIAPAIDMTERLMWRKFPEHLRDEFLEKGFYERPSMYDDGPYLITRGLIEEGRDHLLLDAPFATHRPVRILHGMQDPDVPWQLSLELAEHLDNEDVVLQLIKDGDHRLSRDQDIAMLIRTIRALD